MIPSCTIYGLSRRRVRANNEASHLTKRTHVQLILFWIGLLVGSLGIAMIIYELWFTISAQAQTTLTTGLIPP
jgi:hypothetical protein